jgi:glycosyltransferase involved in cell wall biosynthesis
VNILLITYQGGLAGSTNSISYLATGLADRGHDVYVAAPASSLLRDLIAGSAATFLPMEIRGRFDFRNMRAIRDVVRAYSIQIINAQSSYDRFTTVLARWLYRLPVKIVHTRRQISGSIGGWLQNVIYVKGTDKIVAVGTGVKDTLVRGGIPSSHIEVIYNGTPAEKYAHADGGLTESLKKKFELRVGEPVIGCVSRRKLQHQLVEAVCNLPFAVTLVFVGMQREEPLVRMISKARARHRLFFEGDVHGKDVLSYYPLFNVNVLCSVTEGLSQSLLEAMYLKVPVIATRASGNTDLIRPGENGLLYPDGDIGALTHALTTLLENPALARRYAQEAFKTASVDFSIERTVDGYEKLFESLLSSRPQ